MYVCWITNKPLKPYECNKCSCMSCQIVTGFANDEKWLDEEKDLKVDVLFCKSKEVPKEGSRMVLERIDGGVYDVLTDVFQYVSHKVSNLYEARTEKKTYYIVVVGDGFEISLKRF